MQTLEIIPRHSWPTVVVQENNEPLVPITETDFLKYVPHIGPHSRASNKARETVAEMLTRVSVNLPEDRVLGLINGYSDTEHHASGGGVDVVLLYRNGVTPLDFGSKPFYALVEKAKAPMFTTNISMEATTNRKLLRETMVRAGFVFNPEVWWHYSYGDMMWAIYKHKLQYMYGRIGI